MCVSQHCLLCESLMQYLIGVAILRAFCYATLQKNQNKGTFRQMQATLANIFEVILIS